MTQKQNKKLHILFNGVISDDSISGGDQLILDLGKRFPEWLHSTIILPEKAKKYWNSLNLKNTQIYSIPNSFFDKSLNPIFVFMTYLRRALISYQILKKEEVNIIVSCSDVVLADILPAFLLKRKKKEIFWISRVYHLILPPSQRKNSNFLVNTCSYLFQKFTFFLMKQRCDLVLALNDKLYQDLLKQGFPKEKLGVLGAGIDLENIKNHRKKKDYPYQAVSLGRIHPVKGVFDLVKVWKEVTTIFPDYKLAIIGSGAKEFIEELKNKIKEANLEKNIDLLGYLPKENVLDILKSSKVFLCADYENGWGLAICEAMACSLPVIAYDLDIFGNVYNQGYLCAPLGDTNQFTNNLLTLFKDEEKRKNLATKALEQSEKFGNNKIIQNFLSMYSFNSSNS